LNVNITILIFLCQWLFSNKLFGDLF